MEKIEIWTIIIDEWEHKIISSLFTASGYIKNESQSKWEQVYAEFDWYSWDVSLDWIREKCEILPTSHKE